MFPEHEIEQRMPIWVASSDVFLDTDSSFLHDAIVRACAASAFSLEQLESILKNEVAPVLMFNLLNVAGEWTMFDKAWLVDEISKHLNNTNKLTRLTRNIYYRLRIKSYVNSQWKALSSGIQTLRQ